MLAKARDRGVSWRIVAALLALAFVAPAATTLYGRSAAAKTVKTSTKKAVRPIKRRHGRAATVYVRPGQHVRRGQLLARVADPGAAKAEQRAESTLKQTRARLAAAKRKRGVLHRNAAVWAEKAAVVRIRQSGLDAARAAARDHKMRLQQEVAHAAADLVDVANSTRPAQAETRTVAHSSRRTPSTRVWDARIKTARQRLAAAQKKAGSGTGGERVTAAQAQLDATTATQAQNATAYQAAVDQAQAALATAQATRSADADKLTTAKADRETSRADVDTYEAKIADQQTRVDSDRSALDACKASPPPEGCSALQGARNKDVAKLEDLKGKLHDAEAGLTQAKADVDELSRALEPDDAAVSSAETTLAQAQQAQTEGVARDDQAVQSGRDALTQAQKDAGSETIAFQSAVIRARKDLEGALRGRRTALAKAQPGSAPRTVVTTTTRRSSASGSGPVEAARRRLAIARANRASGTAHDQAAVETAAGSLAGARQALSASLATAPALATTPTSHDLAVAETKLEIARLELRLARANRVAKTELRASRAGAVEQVQPTAGLAEAVVLREDGVARLRAAAGIGWVAQATADLKPTALETSRDVDAARLERLKAQLAVEEKAAVNGRSGVVGIAMRYLGIPYVWGGGSPSAGFDCSGLVQYVYTQVGVSLPHYAASQFNYGVPVARDELEPGDLVFFENLGHVGIYIGNGEFIHAPHTGDVVKISSLDSVAYALSYVGARRISTA